MISIETLEKVEEYTYLGQTVSRKPAHEKNKKSRKDVGWSALEKNGDIMKSNLSLSIYEEKVQLG